MIKYHITTFEFKGSIKDKLKDIDLPESAIPMGFDIIIQNMDTHEQHCEFWLGSTEVQSEWIDDEHTCFVAVIDGKLKRYQVITRVYCMIPKAGIPASADCRVDLKDHSEILL